jgi:hypothetical protein
MYYVEKKCNRYCVEVPGLDPRLNPKTVIFVIADS